MGWGIRVLIFTVAFITGIIVSNIASPAVIAPAEPSGNVELSDEPGSSLVVSCMDGSPSIQEVKGAEGAVELKCSRSEIRVIRSIPSIPKPDRLFKVPSPPIAAAIPSGK